MGCALPPLPADPPLACDVCGGGQLFVPCLRCPSEHLHWVCAGCYWDWLEPGTPTPREDRQWPPPGRRIGACPDDGAFRAALAVMRDG